ncbi:hypothetical protein KUDE01_003300 [Dissostichus eleginoides]|uniref:Uncharacterized protein n=1 Tax=Dissostichus eleginoides TaxID=100907 RepID=A0AAD9B611_DISEL|nr:hypothetical protein KUDE01_003300 [Dissostichus eleginoides]
MTPNLTEDQKSDTSVHPRSSQVYDEHNPLIHTITTLKSLNLVHLKTQICSSRSPPKISAPYPTYPYPFPYYYFPHMAPGEDKGLPPPNLSEDQKSDTSVHPRSSQVLDEHNLFNPFYHYYYHHFKIPQPDLPQDPDSGPEAPGEQSLTHFTQNPEFLEKSHQFLQPGPEAASFTSSLPQSPPKISAPDAPSHPHPYPFPYYYFPHIARGDAKSLAPLNPEMTPNFSEDQKSDTSVDPRSSQVHNEPNSFNPYYHYYQQPDILLRASHQDPKPGPEVPEEPALSKSFNPEFPTQQSEVLRGVISHQFPQPVTEAAFLISSLPENPPKTSATDAPPPPHPYPFPYYYFLHIARGDVKRSAPLDPETGPDTSVHPRSSQPNTFNPYYHYQHLKIPLPGKPQDTIQFLKSLENSL